MENNQKIDISISEKGFFVDGERLNMLEYRFLEIFRSKSNFYHISENKPSFQNCAIFYVHSNDMAYIDTMDIWFTPDDSPFTKKDFDRLEKFYADSDPRFNEQNHKYILSANIHLDILKKIGLGEDFTLPTGIDEISYTAGFYSPKETRLHCFHLSINPIHTDDFIESGEYKIWEAVRKGDLEELTRYAETGKNLTFHDRLTLATLLDLAIATNNPKICEFLIGRGFDVNYIALISSFAKLLVTTKTGSRQEPTLEIRGCA